MLLWKTFQSSVTKAVFGTQTSWNKIGYRPREKPLGYLNERYHVEWLAASLT